jgi:hypothetical protein
MTKDLDSEVKFSRKDRVRTVGDILTELDSDEVHEEAQQPKAISTLLHTHQRQALTFLKHREDGWNLHGARSDL